MRAQGLRSSSHGGRFGDLSHSHQNNSYQAASSEFPRPRAEMRRSGWIVNGAGVRQRFQQGSPQIYSGYADAGSVGGGGSWNQTFQANPLTVYEATPIFQGARPETMTLTQEETKKRVARFSQKRSRTDTDFLSVNVEDNSEDTGCTLQGSTKVSKRIKVSL